MPTRETSHEMALPVSHDEIRTELAKILESPPFRGSQRCQDFLRHILEQTLKGGREGLKERTIGVELFGRSPTYDTSADGIVRIRASEVRKRLALYYADVGKNSQILITLPLGSYLPTISRTSGAQNNNYVQIDEHPKTDAPNSSLHRESYRGSFAKLLATKKLWIASLLTLAALLVIVEWVHVSSTRTISKQFWQPLTGSSGPVLVITSYTPVYLPPSHSSPIDAPYRLLTDRYVGGGDLVAAVLVSSMLTDFHHPYDLKMNTAIALDDLRDKPTVLIGYASTQWADLTRNFRFFIQRGMVTDRGKDTDWRPRHDSEDQHVEEDYAVISRAFDPETHSMIVLVSGCTGYGTEAAARLVTDQKLLGAALSNAPKGWQQKNLQLVLHIEVVANSPANAQVVSSYYW